MSRFIQIRGRDREGEGGDGEGCHIVERVVPLSCLIALITAYLSEECERSDVTLTKTGLNYMAELVPPRSVKSVVMDISSSEYKRLKKILMDEGATEEENMSGGEVIDNPLHGVEVE